MTEPTKECTCSKGDLQGGWPHAEGCALREGDPDPYRYVRKVTLHIGASQLTKRQFSIQIQKSLESTVYRITHTATDSRVAVCYDYLNATFVCDALNRSDIDYDYGTPFVVASVCTCGSMPHADNCAASAQFDLLRERDGQ